MSPVEKIPEPAVCNAHSLQDDLAFVEECSTSPKRTAYPTPTYADWAGVPRHIRIGNAIQRTWSASYFGKWIEARKQLKLEQLRSYEAKSSESLAAVSNLPLLEYLEQINSTLTGLSDDQASERLVHDGPNILSAAKPRRWWTILLACLPNPFNLLLTVLAIISIATQQTATFVILMVMVIVSVTLRFWQELKNNRAMNELVTLFHDDVFVIRARVEKQVPKASLVVGDLVRLGGGDVIPADVLLIDTAGLYVSQSTLTGEGIPVLKQLTDDVATPGSIFECPRICFAGTSITSGNGLGIVAATGDDTYVGSLSRSLNQKLDSTEFERGVRRVSYMLISFMLLMVPIVLIINGFVSKDWGEAALFCISVAVGITPEMLPMIINANLCHAALKLAKLKVIVKRLDSVQTLGAIDVLCSDKTGTLTKDDIVLQSAVDANNTHSEMTLRLAFLNASFQEGLRNAIDSAIVHYTETHLGLETVDKLKQDFEKVAELPFDFDRRLLSVVVRGGWRHAMTKIADEDALIIITKGAAEEVLAKCTHVHWEGEVLPLTLERRLHLEELCTSLNEQGMRTVGVARRNLSLGNLKGESVTTADEMDLEFEGFLAFLDPPKDDAADAVKELRRLGVAVKVLTGDNTAAAKAVASQIGLMDSDSDGGSLVISGPELTNLDLKAFQEAVERCVLFTKLKPLQKQEIVRTLMQAEHSVGFLGDGINDAAALRAADVGISVDTATSVAKHAANIILLQKSLTHVISGVVYGRITHANTMKYIKMAASGNFGNIFSVTIAAAWLPFVPMAPLQLIVQNLMYDLSQTAIPWDNVDPELTASPRKWHVWGIVRFMIWFGPTSSIFDIWTFLLGWYYYGIQTTANNVEVETFQTQWFTEGLLTQVLVVVMLRTQHIPFFQSWPSRQLGSMLVLMSVIGLALPYIPNISSGLQMQRPHPTFYGFLVAILLSYMLLAQGVKAIYRKIYKEWL